MLPALVSLKGLIKNKFYHIDYPLFRLHYQATACALMAFCLILSAKVLFGDIIDCRSRAKGEDKFVDSFCYSHGTTTRFTIEPGSLRRDQLDIRGDKTSLPDFVESSSLSEKQSKANSTYEPSSSDAFPINFLAQTSLGEWLKNNFRLVHRFMRSNSSRISPTIQYLYSGIPIPSGVEDKYQAVYRHQYYQYIPIMLFLQATFFYFPHYLWKSFEKGTVSSICKQLYDNRFAPTDYIESNYQLIDYLNNSFNINKSLVFKYYFCHLLLFINLIAQIIALNAVFNNQFVTYGLDVFQYLFIDTDVYGLRGPSASAAELNNPMDFVFPKITACDFHVLSEGGPAPNSEPYLCILALNIFHDKFFLLIWVWFFILAALTVLQILFDMLYMTLPALRKYLFKRKFGPYLGDGNKHCSSLSELFMLDLIGSNSDRFAFAALLRKLNKDDWRLNPDEVQSLV